MSLILAFPLVPFFLLGIGSQDAASAVQFSCDSVEREIAKDFSRAALAMEPESTIRGIYDRATEAQRRCENSEPLAYFRVRAAELGKGASLAPLSATSEQEWRALAHDMFRRFPRSPRIATVEARAVGTIASAKDAMTLDPTYLPALVALAAAAVATGDAAGGKAVLEGKKNLDATSDGYAVLARAQFEAGDLRGAEFSANKTLHARSAELVEPDARDPRPEITAHEVLGLIALRKKRYPEAARHLLQAEVTSPKARAALTTPDADFQRALLKLRRAKNR
ncbi:MAG TPA: hypothetical protein VFH68_20130 [Polyangia bacterium]|nr:hypothetical protein [Polyangia bacterium]